MTNAFQRTALSLALSGALAICAALTAFSRPLLNQGRPTLTPDFDLEHGALLFHGNYCGPGNRGPRVPPVDALDLACKHHDACTPSSYAPSTCACNARLEAEASGVADDPRQPADLRALAGLVAAGVTALPCQHGRAVARYRGTAHGTLNRARACAGSPRLTR